MWGDEVGSGDVGNSVASPSAFHAWCGVVVTYRGSQFLVFYTNICSKSIKL